MNIDGTMGNRQQSNGSQNTASYSNSVTPTAAKGQVRRQGAVNWSHTLVFANTNVPQVVPGYLVPPGSSVRVRGNNGGVGGNAQVVYAATNPDSLRAGLGTPLQPLDDVAFPVDNTARIWAMGKAGDGIVIAVSDNNNS
jgi:hypothetical protein